MKRRIPCRRFNVSTHSRPKAADCTPSAVSSPRLFQHTAARRRLLRFFIRASTLCSFNTQPPEGGCRQRLQAEQAGIVSTHSRPKAAEKTTDDIINDILFQHTAARRRLFNHAWDKHIGVIMFQHTAARRRLTTPIPPM